MSLTPVNDTFTGLDSAGNRVEAELVRIVGGPNGGIPVQMAPFATATTTQVSASVSSVPLLAANAVRMGVAKIYYDGAADLFVHEGSDAATAINFAVKLGGTSGIYYWESTPGYVGALQGIWSAATGKANVTEETA